jgi:APA family basic amino acid/polyamine antiporter
MSCRGLGIAPEKFSKLGRNQSVSLLSCVYGFGCMTLMLGIWYLAMHGVWIFKYLGGMDEVACAIIYGVYITMYVNMMKNFKDLNVFSRFIMPVVATLGALFFVICGTGVYQLMATGSFESVKAFGVFLILFVLLMSPCLFFYREKAGQTFVETEENAGIDEDKETPLQTDKN